MLNKLEIYNFKNMGRGMRATSDISPGDIIVKVPLNECIISNALTPKPVDYRISMENWNTMDYIEKTTTLVILAYESGSHKYLQTLPKHLNLIDTWEGVTGHILQLKLQRINENEKRLRKFKWCDRQTALYFLDIVRTRSIYSDVSCGLYPLLDLFNHDTTTNKDFDYDLEYTDEYIVFRSTRYVRRGEQFFVSYGDFSVSELAYYYGIIT